VLFRSRFEVRRLHDTYRYTTIYVTHDQSEAMTAADLIVIMNAGRIEQTGTPEEIYQRPRTEFVARFIGGSNILRGPVVDGGRVMIAGVALRCDRADVAHGGPASVSVRPHDVGLSADPAAQGGENRLPATIVRQAFLGGSRDYVVEIADGTQLRVSAPAAQSIPSGTAIWLELPYERCRILTG
jgi:iron(III) transport system ATP-binding protein